jgi:hypothetical protein
MMPIGPLWGIYKAALMALNPVGQDDFDGALLIQRPRGEGSLVYGRGMAPTATILQTLLPLPSPGLFQADTSRPYQLCRLPTPAC